jgi:hypothetical protein
MLCGLRLQGLGAAEAERPSSVAVTNLGPTILVTIVKHAH